MTYIMYPVKTHSKSSVFHQSSFGERDNLPPPLFSLFPVSTTLNDLNSVVLRVKIQLENTRYRVHSYLNKVVVREKDGKIV